MKKLKNVTELELIKKAKSAYAQAEKVITVKSRDQLDEDRFLGRVIAIHLYHGYGWYSAVVDGEKTFYTRDEFYSKITK